MSPQSLDELVYKLHQETYDEGQLIFGLEDKLEKIYILTDGSVSIFLPFNDNDLVLDTIKIAGSTLGQYSNFKNSGIGYSARAV